MEHFLNLVAEDLYNNFRDPETGLSDVTVVFPNRRARLFFDEYLSQCSDRPMWSPSYMTITELFQSQSKLSVADPFKLVSILYDIYRNELHSDETADSFWSWGELMLNDFDDIDRNMAEADRIFICLQNHKEIEGQPFLSDRQQEVLKDFFAGFEGERSALKQKCIEIWNALGPVYEKFRETLFSGNMAYEGMLQRDVASSINPDMFSGRLYAFVGFNSLNRAEKVLFRTLKESGKALFYWDYDRSYLDDPTSESGMFLRENMAEFPNRLGAEHFDNFNSGKKLTIVESSSDTAQTRYIPQWIDSLQERPDKDTAIVLCDSGLLQSVLHSISPDSTDTVNITMGYPLNAIPLCSFVTALIDIQRLSLRKDCRLTIGHAEKILNNPLTARISPNAASLYDELKESHRHYPEMSELRKDEALTAIFTECTDNISLTDNILKVLRMLAPKLDADSDGTVFQPLYSEALYRIYTQVSRFRTLSEDGTLQISTEMMCRLLRKVISSGSVPFHGEPVAGMQVMGLIETRNLDFRNVLLLSATEGTLPSGTAEASFIPYSIRKAFGLTTMQEKSAVSSYNFHHLIQRAEHVTMIYNGNTDSTGTGKGQISRYLLQLIVSGRKIDRITLEPDHNEQSSEHTFSIGKSDVIMQRLYSMYDYSDSRTYLSPSAINCYLDCRFKYYLQYIAGLKALRDETVEIDAAMFGTLFHLSAELTYGFIARQNGGTVTRDALESLIRDSQKTGSFVRKAFRQELFENRDVDPEEYNGTQTVNFEVIRKYLLQMLKMDLVYAPFTYLGSEMGDCETAVEIPHPDNPADSLKIRLSGRIDRMDCRDGIYRIADYKTGHVEKNPVSMDKLFTGGGKDRCRYALQTFYYATIVHSKAEFRDCRLAPVLLYLRRSAKPSEEDIYMKMGGEPVTDFAADYLDEYQERLRGVIEEMFDRKVPFTQTDDIRNTCARCDFRSLCRRNVKG